MAPRAQSGMARTSPRSGNRVRLEGSPSKSRVKNPASGGTDSPPLSARGLAGELEVDLLEARAHGRKLAERDPALDKAAGDLGGGRGALFGRDQEPRRAR